MSNFNIMFYGESLYILAIKLFLGAAAAFLAILFWRKTRTPAEIVFILGILSMYVSVLYKTLQRFGFFVFSYAVTNGIDILTALFDIVPIVFFIISLALFVKSR